jgi:hypothetical protein
MGIVNRVVAWLLRSPLHRVLSGGVPLVTVTGRRSGRRYTTPAQYARHRDALYLASRTERRWWRNLRGGAPVQLRLRGRDVRGRGEVIEPGSADAVAARELLREGALRRAIERDGAVLLRVRLDDQGAR